MIVQKAVEAKATANPDKFVAEVQKIIADLEQKGATILLAIWGRKTSSDPRVHNKLFAEICFFAAAHYVRLGRGENEVETISPVVLGPGRVRDVMGMLKGEQRGNTIYPHRMQMRRPRIGFRLGL